MLTIARAIVDDSANEFVDKRMNLLMKEVDLHLFFLYFSSGPNVQIQNKFHVRVIARRRKKVTFIGLSITMDR
jgi:hypothetical protein